MGEYFKLVKGHLSWCNFSGYSCDDVLIHEKINKALNNIHCKVVGKSIEIILKIENKKFPILREGTERKGGINEPPVRPKPNIKPAGQG